MCCMASSIHASGCNEMKRLLSNRAVIVSAILLVLIILLAVIGPLVYQVDPSFQDVDNLRAFPTLAHPLGSDDRLADRAADADEPPSSAPRSAWSASSCPRSVAGRTIPMSGSRSIPRRWPPKERRTEAPGASRLRARGRDFDSARICAIRAQRVRTHHPVVRLRPPAAEPEVPPRFSGRARTAMPLPTAPASTAASSPGAVRDEHRLVRDFSLPPARGASR